MAATKNNIFPRTLHNASLSVQRTEGWRYGQETRVRVSALRLTLSVTLGKSPPFPGRQAAPCKVRRVGRVSRALWFGFSGVSPIIVAVSRISVFSPTCSLGRGAWAPSPVPPLPSTLSSQEHPTPKQEERERKVKATDRVLDPRV